MAGLNINPRSYPTLTELTRNPPSTRRSYEKNWVLFSPSPSATYLQYELTPSQRTLAQVIGGGLTTLNLTDSLELPCLNEMTLAEIESNKRSPNAIWHQATPSLKLVLCNRTDLMCHAKTPQTVFFAAIQRKQTNIWKLPIRYERHFVVWSTTPPFKMLAVSRHPILLANETSTGWSASEVWDDRRDALTDGRSLRTGFTYTTTIAYAWGRDESDVRDKGTGYLDDEVIMSIGVNDQEQNYATVIASELLQCLRACPGKG